MFKNPESGIDSLLGELNCAANFINSSSFNSLLADWQEFTSQQLLTLAGETLIQAWQNQYEPSQALVYAAGSIFKSDFAANAQIAFGDAFDVNQAEALGAEIFGGNYGVLPDLQFLSDANMNGALGAYANSTNTIYINRDFLTQSSDNPIAIAKILVEEAGHFLDADASYIDSPGDEGEILTDLISGQQLTVDELTQLRAEDDSTTIFVDGQFLQVEQRADKDDFNGDGISDILLRNGTSIDVWLVNGNAQVTAAIRMGNVPVDWQIQGVADFNGNGVSDIVFRNGTNIDVYLVNSDFQLTPAIRMGNVPVDWQIQGIADFNGNGVSDIVFRNETNIDVCLVNSDFQLTPAIRMRNAAVDWHIQLTPVNLTAPLGLMTTAQKLTTLINGQLNGLAFDVDGYYGAQCWDLVAYATGNTTSTYNWKRGENVMANSNIAVGTAIATFLGPNHTYDTPPNYSSQHTAIFAGYGVEYGVAGFYVWDQNWNWKQYVQKHFIRSNGSGTSDADNYYVIHV